PAASPELIWRVTASAVLLFRYSALTFNGHRIHYDHAYATETEGYAGLVVHGPLQASLILNLAAAHGRSAPRRLAYRATAPLIASGGFDVCGARRPDGNVECWVRDDSNRVTMAATAFW
ncbi:MAG: acyl-CoA dehydrogenase, partial [Dongiaceae bacterium]